MTDLPELAPPWSRIPLVHDDTDLFPEPTLGAMTTEITQRVVASPELTATIGEVAGPIATGIAADAATATVDALAPSLGGDFFPFLPLPDYAATMDALKTADVYAMWDDLIADHPAQLTTVDLGADQSGAFQIRKITLTPTEGFQRRARYLVIANVHGHEPNGDAKAPAVVLFELVKAMLERRTQHTGLQALYAGAVLDIIPVGNPWGYDNDNRRNSRGVDINRNYNAQWDTGGSPTPGDIQYRGASPASEAETQIIQGVVNATDYDAVIDFHCHGYKGYDVPYEYVYYGNTGQTKANRAAEASFGFLSQKYDRPITTSRAGGGGTMRTYSEVQGKTGVTIEFTPFVTGKIPYSAELMGSYAELLGNYMQTFLAMYGPNAAADPIPVVATRTTFNPAENAADGELLTVLTGGQLWTDFGTDALGAAPAGWSTRWSDDTWTVEADSSLSGGKKLVQIASGSDARRGLAWDLVEDVAAPEDLADVEVVVKWYGLASVNPLRPMVRGSGALGAEAGYYGGVRNGTSQAIGKLVGGVNTLPVGASPTGTFPLQNWYITRLRVEGDAIKVRTWKAGDPEPSTWHVETTDTSITAGGWVGLYISNNNVRWIDWFGVGIGGLEAPTSAPLSGTTPVAVKYGVLGQTITLWEVTP